MSSCTCPCRQPPAHDLLAATFQSQIQESDSIRFSSFLLLRQSGKYASEFSCIFPVISKFPSIYTVVDRALSVLILSVFSQLNLQLNKSNCTYMNRLALFLCRSFFASFFDRQGECEARGNARKPLWYKDFLRLGTVRYNNIFSLGFFSKRKIYPCFCRFSFA